MTAILALVSCDRYNADGYKFANSAYLDVSSHSSSQIATFGNNIPEFTKELSVMLSYPSEADAAFTVSVDETLVEQYNARYGTEYEMLPARYYEFPSVSLKVEAGRTMSESASVRFKGLMGDGEEQTGAMEIDHTYLLPVKLSSANMELMQAASVAYYLVRRSSAITVAAQLTDNWINFPTLDQPGQQSDAFNGLKALTYEALIFIDRFDLDNDFGTCNISSVMGISRIPTAIEVRYT